MGEGGAPAFKDALRPFSRIPLSLHLHVPKSGGNLRVVEYSTRRRTWDGKRLRQTLRRGSCCTRVVAACLVGSHRLFIFLPKLSRLNFFGTTAAPKRSRKPYMYRVSRPATFVTPRRKLIIKELFSVRTGSALDSVQMSVNSFGSRAAREIVSSSSLAPSPARTVL